MLPTHPETRVWAHPPKPLTHITRVAALGLQVPTVRTEAVGVHARRPVTADAHLGGPVYARDLPSSFVSTSFNRNKPWL